MTDIPFHFRLPTGAIRTQDDWPSLHVRGDDCFLLLSAIQSVFAGDLKHPSLGYLKKLGDIITKEVIVYGPEESPG